MKKLNMVIILFDKQVRLLLPLCCSLSNGSWCSWRADVCVNIWVHMEQSINLKSLSEIKISISHFCVFDIKKIFLFQASFRLSVFLELVMVKITITISYGEKGKVSQYFYFSRHLPLPCSCGFIAQSRI